MSIRIKAAMVMILIVFGITVIGFFTYNGFASRSLMETMEKERALDCSLAVEIVRGTSDRLIAEASSAAAGLKPPKSPVAWQRELEATAARYTDFTGFTVFSRGGTVASYGDSPATESFRTLYSRYLDAAFEGRSVISTTKVHIVSEKLVLFACVPMADGHVLAATIPSTAFSHLFKAHSSVWEAGGIFVVDSEGVLVAHKEEQRTLERVNYIDLAKTDPNMASIGGFLRRMLEDTKNGKTGAGIYTLNGKEMLCAYEGIRSDHVDWSLGVSSPLDESALPKVRGSLMTSSLLLLGMGMIAAVLFSAYVARPHYKLLELNKTIRAQSDRIKEEHARMKLMLDITPLACHFFDQEGRSLDCNEEAVRLFKMKDKQECCREFMNLSPGRQPDGRPSYEAAVEEIRRAFDEGERRFEWVHRLADGTLMPAEIKLVRVNYEDGFAVVCYARDLREYKEMMRGIAHRDGLMNTVKNVASLLLATAASRPFVATLQESMGLVGAAVDADRVQVWQNQVIEGGLHFVLKYEWLSETGKEAASLPLGLHFPYSAVPKWESMFLDGKHINSPLSSLSPGDQAFLGVYDIQSIVIIPIFLEDRFWGFFSVDDCRRERLFTDDEIDTMRSVGLMYSSAMNREAQSDRIKEALKRTGQILDATPVCCDLWDSNRRLILCNEHNVRLFRMSSREEYMSRFLELSPEVQPDGQNSAEKSDQLIGRALEGERLVFHWMHRLTDGTQLPMEITLVRLLFGDRYVVAAYKNDLRQQKQMMKEMEYRDALLLTINEVAAKMLRTDQEHFEADLGYCLLMVSDTLGTDIIVVSEDSSPEGGVSHTDVCRWSRAEGLKMVDAPPSRDYAAFWDRLRAGEKIHCPAISAVPEMRAKMESQGISSAMLVPVFIGGKFWGVISYGHSGEEKAFTKSERVFLRSVSLALVYAMK